MLNCMSDQQYAQFGDSVSVPRIEVYTQTTHTHLILHQKCTMTSTNPPSRNSYLNPYSFYCPRTQVLSFNRRGGFDVWVPENNKLS